MVASYLRDGWPVVVTGSQFFGGPAFSGAVLFPSVQLVKNPGVVLATAAISGCYYARSPRLRPWKRSRLWAWKG